MRPGKLVKLPDADVHEDVVLPPRPVVTETVALRERHDMDFMVRCLIGQRIALTDRAPCEHEFLVGYSFAVDAVDLLEDFFDRGRRDVVTHACLDDVTSRRFVGAQISECTVGVAFVLPQIEVDPAVE